MCLNSIIFNKISEFCLIIFKLVLFAGIGTGVLGCFEEVKFSERLQLTPAEVDWLHNHSVLRLAPERNYPPLTFVDQNGVHRGISADYIKLIEEKLNIRFEVLPPAPLAHQLERLKKGEADVLTSLTNTSERARFLNFTEPYVALPTVIVVRKTIQKHLLIDEMEGMKIAVGDRYAVHGYLLENHGKLKYKTVPDDKEGLRSVSFGEVDALVADLASASFLIEKNRITNLRVAGELDFSYQLCMASRKDWPILNRILSKALKNITEQEREKIFRKWIHIERVTWGPNPQQITTVLVVSGGILFLLILYWNRTLRVKVKQRTLKLEELNRLLEKEKSNLEKVSVTDELTGVYNRRHVLARLRNLVELAQRYERPFALALIDLDHFKEINDSHGHQVGDLVLSEVAQRINANIRKVDVLGRYAGEEFLLLLPETSLADSRNVLDKIRNKISGAQWDENGLKVTISAGLVEYNKDETDTGALRRADDFLFRAKKMGRNRVESFGYYSE